MLERGTALEAMVAGAAARSATRRRPSSRGFKANAIERVGGRWVGAADPRSEGAGGRSEWAVARHGRTERRCAQLEHFPNLVAMFFARAAEKGDAPFLWAKQRRRMALDQLARGGASRSRALAAALKRDRARAAATG